MRTYRNDLAPVAPPAGRKTVPEAECSLAYDKILERLAEAERFPDFHT